MIMRCEVILFKLSDQALREISNSMDQAFRKQSGPEDRCKVISKKRSNSEDLLINERFRTIDQECSQNDHEMRSEQGLIK